MRCSVVFGVTLRLIVIKISLSSPDPVARPRKGGLGVLNPPFSSAATQDICAEPMRKCGGTPRNVVLGETSCNIFRKPMILVSCLIIYSNTAVASRMTQNGFAWKFILITTTAYKLKLDAMTSTCTVTTAIH